MPPNNGHDPERNLPQQSREDQVSSKSLNPDIQVTAELHAGPLPSPETVERYEMVLPGAFDRLLTMAENDQRDKSEYNGRFLAIHEQDKRSNRIFAHCGQVFGFAVVVAFFVVLGFTVWIENVTMFGALLGAGMLTGLARLVRSFQNKGK